MIKVRAIISLYIVVFFTSLVAFGQQENKSRKGFLFFFDAGLDLPLGDMSERFGMNYNFGAKASFKTEKSLFFGIDGKYFFTNKVKENPLYSFISSETGTLTNFEGNPALVSIEQKGFYIGGFCAKLFKFKQESKHEKGIFTELGIGLLQHKLKINDTDSELPMVRDEYFKIYDRLSNGLSLHQFVGYMFLENRSRLNFVAGIDFYQAFTKNRRTSNFNTARNESKVRFDALIGPKIGLILPIYLTSKNSRIYY